MNTAAGGDTRLLVLEGHDKDGLFFDVVFREAALVVTIKAPPEAENWPRAIRVRYIHQKLRDGGLV